MITSTVITINSIDDPIDPIYVSTTDGTSAGTGIPTAITTIALCNIGTPDPNDETDNAVDVNIYFAKAGIGYKNFATDGASNIVVSNLTVPAGETVFFSDERIILDADDEIYVGTSYVGDGRICVTVSSLPV
jgi:hypothetical protein